MSDFTLADFMAPDKYIYPPFNKDIFEDYFIRNYEHKEGRRIYIPIAWSSFQRRAAYGKDKGMISHLQKWINKLPRNEKYFTVVTWDDGPLVNFTDLDIKIFAASGPKIDYPIPLLCNNKPYQLKNIAKDIEISFVGAITHPIREKIVRKFQNKKGFYISTRPHQAIDYCKIMARSKYVLCPRGYGQTSFRICESIQYGAIPVYISDDYVIPYNDFDNWEAFRHPLLTLAESVELKGLSLQDPVGFTYEYCMKKILQNI